MTISLITTLRSKALMLAACIIGLSSCATTRYISKDDMSTFNDASLIVPVAEISYMDRNGEVAYDESLTAKCLELLTESALQSSIRISDWIKYDEELFSDDIIGEIIGIRSINPQRAGEVTIPSALDGLLESHGKKYGIIIYAQGFDRDAKNYRKEALKSTFIGIATTIATLGMVTLYPVPERYNLDTWIAVLDAENDKIVYFRHVNREASPTNASHVMRQVNKLTRGL